MLLAAIRDGDLQLLEQCANESIRMAQRSITLREVLHPIDIELESGSHHLERGVFLTTMLSVNNVTSTAGLDTFDPHQRGRRTLADPVLSALPTKEVVSTFGHGPHSCPAARFSISAIRGAVRALVDRYELEPQFREVRPRARQIGGVARAAKPCVVAYSAR